MAALTAMELLQSTASQSAGTSTQCQRHSRDTTLQAAPCHGAGAVLARISPGSMHGVPMTACLAAASTERLLTACHSCTTWVSGLTEELWLLLIKEKEIVSQCIAKQTLQNRTRHKPAEKCTDKSCSGGGEKTAQNLKEKSVNKKAQRSRGTGRDGTQMDGFSFEPSVMPQADTIATAQTLQYVISALSDDADSIISGSLGGHIPPLFSPFLSFFFFFPHNPSNWEL